MKVFHIDEFKCTLCSNWFCPPFSLPYRLKCTHSICTNCLQKSVENKSNEIICPQDLQNNKISQININHSTKKALQRLLKEHNNFTQTNHLECIKSLSLNFDELLDSKQIELKNLSTLMDQIFQNQIKRLRQIYEKIKSEINRPFRIVNDWKQVVRSYLKKVKNTGPNLKGCLNQLNHYIDQGRKIKLDLREYLKYDFNPLIDHLLQQPQVCFTHQFSILNNIPTQTDRYNYCSTSKFQTLGKRVQNQKEFCLHDVTNHFDQSSIQLTKQVDHQQYSVKQSLFQNLIRQTPKHTQQSIINTNKNKHIPLKELIFPSKTNIQEDNSIKSSVLGNLKTGYSIHKQLAGQSKIYNENYQGESLNGFCEQSAGKNFNQMIKQKINKLKTKPTVGQTSIKKPSRMGKSLEYSPQQLHYSEDLLQHYAIHDSFQQKVSNHQNYRINNKNIPLNNFYQEQTTIENPSTQQQPFSIQCSTKHRQFPSDWEQLQGQQMLLEQRPVIKQNKPRTRNGWQLQNLNFLKEWKVNKNSRQQEQLQVIQKYGQYDCEKEKNKYAKKIQQNKVKEILTETNIGPNFIEIVGHSLADCNLTLLLAQVDWSERNIQIVKFIKTSLNDQQLNELLNFMLRSNVHTLMLSYNNLSQVSLDALLNFVQLNKRLKNIYLPKNNISLLKGNARLKINLLKQKGINLYI